MICWTMINMYLVSRVIADDVIELVPWLHGRGRHVETAAPDLYLNKIKRVTSLPYFGVKLSCVCLMFAYRKK